MVEVITYISGSLLGVVTLEICSISDSVRSTRGLADFLFVGLFRNLRTVPRRVPRKIFTPILAGLRSTRGSSVAVSSCYFPSHPRRIAHGSHFFYPRTYTSRSLPVMTVNFQTIVITGGSFPTGSSTVSSSHHRHYSCSSLVRGARRVWLNADRRRRRRTTQ